MKLKIPRFIDNWRKIWWRRWSTWLAAFNALLLGYVFSQPILVIGLLGFVPYGALQIGLVVLVAVLAFGLPVFVAQLKQPKLEKLQEKPENAEPLGNPPTTQRQYTAADAERHANFHAGV